MRRLRPVCNQCAFWNAEPSGQVGHCHRFPPTLYVNAESSSVQQRFPVTDHHQWCGEWNGDDSKLVEAARRSVLKRATAPEK